MPMGPFTLMDMLGIDVCQYVGEYLYGEYGAAHGAAAAVLQAGRGRPAGREERARASTATATRPTSR